MHAAHACRMSRFPRAGWQSAAITSMTRPVAATIGWYISQSTDLLARVLVSKRPNHVRPAAVRLQQACIRGGPGVRLAVLGIPMPCQPLIEYYHAAVHGDDSCHRLADFVSPEAAIRVTMLFTIDGICARNGSHELARRGSHHNTAFGGLPLPFPTPLELEMQEECPRNKFYSATSTSSICPGAGQLQRPRGRYSAPENPRPALFEGGTRLSRRANSTESSPG